MWNLKKLKLEKVETWKNWNLKKLKLEKVESWKSWNLKNLKLVKDETWKSWNLKKFETWKTWKMKCKIKHKRTSAKALDAVFQIAGVQVCGRVNLGLVEDVRLWIRLWWNEHHWLNDYIFSVLDNMYLLSTLSFTTFVIEVFWLEAYIRMWQYKCLRIA